MLLEATSNQLLYQPTLFQCLGQTYFAKVKNLWGQDFIYEGSSEPKELKIQGLNTSQKITISSIGPRLSLGRLWHGTPGASLGRYTVENLSFGH